MRSFTPALIVMLAGFALVLAAAVAWATAPTEHGEPSLMPHIIALNAKKAPPPPKRERGLIECWRAGQGAKPIVGAARCARLRGMPSVRVVRTPQQPL